MTYNMINGDVTEMLPEYVTAQCISSDCAMGAGVVIAFRRKFPRLKEYCLDYVRHNKKDGEIYLPYRHEDKNVGIVYNMFTKHLYWQKAGKGLTYNQYLENLQKSLEYVRDDMVTHKENKLAMPKIASGLDRCNWTDVEKLIKSVFDKTTIEIVICNY